MAARDWAVKKAATQVMGQDERLIASSMISLPGTLKRDGYYAALGNVTGIRLVEVTGKNGLPAKMVAAVTDRRILLFSQHWLIMGRAKELVAEIDLGQVVGAEQRASGRAQVTIKVANFAITLRDGTVLELESADVGGAEGLVRAINGRVAR
jgi:S-adenosylmethionine:diacylglycerol 3-amino-3-carboxypropyl transferase